MNILFSKFSFFKAGQGAFYGGRIYDSTIRQQYTIIYDCGTSSFVSGCISSLNIEIDHFKSTNLFDVESRLTIDILFLSHLDYDHVSGVVRLLKEFDVKKIVLPYFPKDTRKFVLTSFSNPIPENTDFSLNDYTSFIDNPYQFLANFESGDKKRKIHIVLDEDGDNYSSETQNQTNEELTIRGTASNTSVEEVDNINEVTKYKNNLQFFIGSKWEFTTYYKSIARSVYKALAECLNKKLNRQPASAIDIEDIKQLLLTKRSETHACYNLYLSDLNAHGLILMHGPLNFKFIDSRCSSKDSLSENSCINWNNSVHFFPHLLETETKFVGTLLLGDTSLKKPPLGTVFPTYFSDRFASIHICQIPHHGAKKNWDFAAYLQYFTHIENWPVNVCNFGYGNRYGHPSYDVLNDLRTSVVLNSQFLRFSYEYRVYYEK